VNGELARYFESPAAYEQAFEIRLVEHLTGVGQKLLGGDNRSAALDVFDRVLTIDPENDKVLSILDGLNRRRRLRGLLAGVGVAAVIGGSAYALERKLQPVPSGVSYELGESPQIVQHSEDHTQEVVPPIDQPAPVVDAEPVVTPGSGSVVVAPTIDAPPAATGTATTVMVFPPKDAEYILGSDPPRPIPDDGKLVLTLTGPTAITIRNRSGCCQESSSTLTPGIDSKITTRYKPATVIAHCSDHTAIVQINGKSARLDKDQTIAFTDQIEPTQLVKVEFILQSKIDEQHITVRANGTTEVTCDGH